MKRHETKILSFIILAAKLEQEFSEPLKKFTMSALLCKSKNGL